MGFVQYTTKQGDRWDLIAYEAYGDVTKMQIIMDANPAVALTPLIPAGTVLNIPVVEEEEAITLSQLPPWKR